jgi:D-glycero-D-manno-heptose 1,7-bisphosphate phosphatase
MQKAVFLDRDGVINIDKAYVSKIEDFEFCEGVFDVLHHFQSLGYLLIIVTNQSGIGRGYYSEEDFQKLTSWMREEFLHVNIKIDAVYHCPHAPEANCECRKPKSGMFEEAIKAFHIDAKHSWMIGDKPSDIDAALGIGIEQTILIGDEVQNTQAKYCVNFLLDTINLIK